MIRGPLKTARLHINTACATRFHQFRSDQNVIDTQTKMPTKSIHPVIPPAKALLRLIETPESILETQRQPLLKCLALRRAAQNFLIPGHWIMHITVLWCNIEVTHYNQTGMT